uniref:Uncharacterized protein n=1 Tax=Trypanosoma vivax (strain Y486) TaxID=1055687 RepID=G0U0T8_TRYVY|nr:hypothetical protein TVY486_0802970 [Trypanosoma vivax Y486]
MVTRGRERRNCRDKLGRNSYGVTLLMGQQQCGAALLWRRGRQLFLLVSLSSPSLERDICSNVCEESNNKRKKGMELAIARRFKAGLMVFVMFCCCCCCCLLLFAERSLFDLFLLPLFPSQKPLCLHVRSPAFVFIVVLFFFFFFSLLPLLGPSSSPCLE